MFHLFTFRRCNLVCFPMCSIRVDSCLYVLSQEDLLVLLVMLTLSKFVDVGLGPEINGRILNIFCIRFLDLLFWQFLLLIQTYFTSRNFLSDYFSFINLRAFAAIVLRLHLMTLNYFNKLCKFPFRKHVRLFDVIALHCNVNSVRKHT